MRLFACLIVAPQRAYDEPAILSYAISSFCPTSADGLHWSQHRQRGDRGTAQSARFQLRQVHARHRTQVAAAIEANDAFIAQLEQKFAIELRHLLSIHQATAPRCPG